MKKSIFMQMHDGEREGQGSFYQGLQKLFYQASTSKKRKLVEAFPEFFGEEVPEFGVHKEVINSEASKMLKELLVPVIREVLSEREEEIIETTRRVVSR